MMDRLVIFFFTVIRNQVKTGRNIHEYTPLPVAYIKKILGENGGAMSRFALQECSSYRKCYWQTCS